MDRISYMVVAVTIFTALSVSDSSDSPVHVFQNRADDDTGRFINCGKLRHLSQTLSRIRWCEVWGRDFSPSSDAWSHTLIQQWSNTLIRLFMVTVKNSSSNFREATFLHNYSRQPIHWTSWFSGRLPLVTLFVYLLNLGKQILRRRWWWWGGGGLRRRRRKRRRRRTTTTTMMIMTMHRYGIVAFNVPLDTLYSSFRRRFYGSDDPTNSVIALKNEMTITIVYCLCVTMWVWLHVGPKESDFTLDWTPRILRPGVQLTVNVGGNMSQFTMFIFIPSQPKYGMKSLLYLVFLHFGIW